MIVYSLCLSIITACIVGLLLISSIGNLENSLQSAMPHATISAPHNAAPQGN